MVSATVPLCLKHAVGQHALKKSHQMIPRVSVNLNQSLSCHFYSKLWGENLLLFQNQNTVSITQNTLKLFTVFQMCLMSLRYYMCIQVSHLLMLHALISFILFNSMYMCPMNRDQIEHEPDLILRFYCLFLHKDLNGLALSYASDVL